MCFKLPQVASSSQIGNNAWEWSYGKHDEQQFTGLNIVWEGTILHGIFWITIIRVWIFWVGIFRVGVIMGGNFPGGNCPSGSFRGCEFSRWELPRWELPWVEIVGGGESTGYDIFWVGVFLVLLFLLRKGAQSDAHCNRIKPP